MTPLLASGNSPSNREARRQSDLRVTHVVPQLFDVVDGLLGGAERFAFELARHMAHRVRTRLVCFGPRPLVRSVESLQIEVFQPLLSVAGQKSNPLALRPLRILWQSDVLHVHQSHILMSNLLAGLGKLVRVPVFTTDLGGGGWNIDGLVNSQKWYTGHLHISNYSRSVYGHEHSPQARVIWAGVDAARFTPGSGGGGVLFVGRLLPHKGVDVLIEALPTGIPLTVVGPSVDSEYTSFLKRIGSGKAVRFLGPLTEDELVKAYGRADIIALTSVYRDCYGHSTTVPELLGQTLLEGMACALPAIATRVASLPEVVDDGVTGFVVEPNVPSLRAAISALVGQKGLARKMGAAGRQRVLERFSWRETVERCLNAYEDLGV